MKLKYLLTILVVFSAFIASAQIPGNSLRLKANGNYVSIADAASVSLNSDMTWEFWIYYRCENGATPGYPLTKGWCNSTWSYFFEITNGELHFDKFNPAGSGGCPSGASVRYSSLPEAIPFNTWTHIAVVISGTGCQFYINGQPVSTSVAAGSPFVGVHTSPRPIVLGAYQSLGGTYVGILANIDDFRIWHTARTAAEIDEWYNGDLTGNEAGLIAYYKLDETGSGPGITVANSTIGSPLPAGTTAGTAANIYFEDNSSVLNKLPICDPVLWLRADTGITLNGSSEVIQWADQSGHNNHAVADGTTLPTVLSNAINNRPVVRFTDDRLATPLVNLTATNNTEAFLVYKGVGVNGFTPFEFSDDVNVSTTGFYLSDQDNTCPGCQNDVAAGLKGDVDYSQNALNQTQGCPKVINTTYDKSLSTEEVKIWLNGILQPKTPGTTNGNNTNNFGTHKFYLGKRSANCAFCPGVMGEFYFAEMIVFDRVLDSMEKARITLYLQDKYFSGTAASYTSLPLTQTNSTNVFDDLIWKHTYNSLNPAEVIASVKDNCFSLGTRNDTVYVEPTAGQFNGQRYMRRHYVIKTSLNPVGPKTVRLYYTNADFADLQVYLPSLINHGQLVVTKYNGASEDGVYDPNAGVITVIPSNMITTGTAFGQHYLEFEVTGFSEFWIHTGNAPLPLNLISFTANPVGHDALLKWTVADMKDVSGFEIEKSYDAMHFSTLGFVPADEKSEYGYTDDNLIQRSNYYRLKMLDKDGHFKYSQTVLVLSNALVDISLFPNPVGNQLNIVSSSQGFEYSICTVSGQEILHGRTASAQISVATDGISRGIYFIKVRCGEDLKVMKFVKE